MKFNFVILTFCLTCNLNFGITQNVLDLDRDLFEAAKEGEQNKSMDKNEFNNLFCFVS